jgi:hypothetical protein
MVKRNVISGVFGKSVGLWMVSNSACVFVRIGTSWVPICNSRMVCYQDVVDDDVLFMVIYMNVENASLCFLYQ